jgi:hypothetical protein
MGNVGSKFKRPVDRRSFMKGGLLAKALQLAPVC